MTTKRMMIVSNKIRVKGLKMGTGAGDYVPDRKTVTETELEAFRAHVRGAIVNLCAKRAPGATIGEIEAIVSDLTTKVALASGRIAQAIQKEKDINYGQPAV